MIKETGNGLKILVGLDGKEFLFINSGRLTDCLLYMREQDLRYIIISKHQNFDLKNLHFLIGLEDFIEGIVVLDTEIEFHQINYLHKLKYLGIGDNNKDNIDLQNFPHLVVCAMQYSARVKGLENCRNLETLTITGLNPVEQDLTALPVLPNLKHLSLISTGITALNGVERFNGLIKLEITNAPKLVSIAALSNLAGSLKEIQFDHCKRIADYKMLGGLTSLEKIILSKSGEISSLAFILKLPRLRFLSFYGTSVTDGDLSYCSSLEYVGFDDRKHYTHKLKQFR